MGKLVSVGGFATSVTANYAKARLAEAGITARVDGEAFGTALGLSPLGNIRVLVDSDDFDHAKQVLDIDKLSGSAWFCGPCQEPVEPGFDVCWSCGGARSEVAGEPDDVEKLSEPEPKPAPTPVSNNPYEPVPEQEASPEDVYDADTAEAEGEVADILRRARNATFVGVGFFPLIPYGTWLLCQVAGRTEELSEKRRQQFHLACLFNACLLLVYSMLFLIPWL